MDTEHKKKGAQMKLTEQQNEYIRIIHLSLVTHNTVMANIPFIKKMGFSAESFGSTIEAASKIEDEDRVYYFTDAADVDKHALVNIFSARYGYKALARLLERIKDHERGT